MKDKRAFDLAGLLSRALALPPADTGAQSRVTVSGGRMVVENHKGIVALTGDSLRLRTLEGSLSVYGRDLVLEGVGAEGLILTGRIDKIEFD